MDQDIDALRRRLAGALPAGIARALAGYDSFTAGLPPDDPKGFAAWHAAARAALAHVDLLVRLVRWAQGGTSVGADADDPVEALLAQARAALAGFDADDPEGG